MKVNLVKSQPCPCWAGAVSLHDLHCCFRSYDAVINRVTCGHDRAGMRAFDRAQAVVAS